MGNLANKVHPKHPATADSIGYLVKFTLYLGLNIHENKGRKSHKGQKLLNDPKMLHSLSFFLSLWLYLSNKYISKYLSLKITHTHKSQPVIKFMMISCLSASRPSCPYMQSWRASRLPASPPRGKERPGPYSQWSDLLEELLEIALHLIWIWVVTERSQLEATLSKESLFTRNCILRHP